jgi:hypothetical protein
LFICMNCQSNKDIFKKYSVNCWKLKPLPLQCFQLNKIDKEVKILSSRRTNRLPHRSRQLPWWREQDYQLSSCVRILNCELDPLLKFVGCKCKSKRVGMSDMKITYWLLRLYMFMCIYACMYYVCAYVWTNTLRTHGGLYVQTVNLTVLRL